MRPNRLHFRPLAAPARCPALHIREIDKGPASTTGAHTVRSLCGVVPCSSAFCDMRALGLCGSCVAYRLWQGGLGFDLLAWACAI